MKKLFSIIIATFVCWCGLIPGSFHFFQQKKKKTRLTNSNFGEYPQVSCFSKKNEREVVEKKLSNEYEPLFIRKGL